MEDRCVHEAMRLIEGAEEIGVSLAAKDQRKKQLTLNTSPAGLEASVNRVIARVLEVALSHLGRGI